MIRPTPSRARTRGGTGMQRFRNLQRLFIRFAPLLSPHRRRLALAAACMLGFIATDLATPWPVQIVIDGVLLNRPNRGALKWLGGSLPSDPVLLLALCSAAVVVIAALRALFSYGQNLLAASVGQQVVSALRLSVFERLQRLSLTFHGKHRTGDLLVRVTGDVSLLREILVPSALEFCARALVLAGMVTAMALMDPFLTVIAVAILPLLAFSTMRFGMRIREASRQQRQNEGRIAGVAAEAFASLAMVQAYSRESEVAARLARQSVKSLSAGLTSLRLEESLSRIVELTLAAASCLVLWAGARRSLAGGMSPGELLVYLGYLRSLYRPVYALVRLGSKASKAVVSGERVLEVLDSEEEVRQADDAVPAPTLKGEIVFEHVGFGYEPDRPVLDDVSFRIAPGERVGLVGPSGAGKSTIVALLLRLYDPHRGRILIDGVDIRRFQIDSYRRQTAVVLQEPFLLGTTAGENIRGGRPEASDSSVQEAARAAGADEFLAALPEGYHSILGERGSSLSRGQQQRVSLARAVLRDAPVLIFDEPTTGLDTRTEMEVRETLARLARGRTCLWIAHGLDQILDCSRVIVLREGRMVETGDPAELLEASDGFRRLFGRSRR